MRRFWFAQPGIITSLRVVFFSVACFVVTAAVIAFAEVQKLDHMIQDLRDVQNVLNNPDAEVVEIAEKSAGKLEIARTSLETAMDRLQLVLVATAVLLVIAMVAAIYLLVERKINRRMKTLTEAVLKIAAGAHDHRVDIQGSDEIARMANALETFKNTAEELHRSNAELTRFAYAAAHDLRAPLRGIQDLATWTLEDEHTALSEESREYMDLLQQRVARLGRLMRDLLDYAQVGQEAASLRQVNVADMVAEMAELFDTSDAFDIHVSEAPPHVTTFATSLHQILWNLISNAIKHHDKGAGVISVSVDVKDGRLVATVEDDGPGIDPQYHNRVFGLFQTLKSRDEVEGSGLGLAMVKKLIDHYGGSISIISNPAQSRGTSVVFELPELSVPPQAIKLAA